MPTTTTKYYYYTKQNVADIHLLLYRDADEYSLGETVPGRLLDGLHDLSW
jgi:hypothetical protein